MTDPPVFSKLDADWILKRAAEIEGSEDAGPVSVDELRAIAGEAGFGSHAVERALAEAHGAATSRGGVTEIRVFVSKFLLRRGKWMGWVNAAADRLETLVFLMATQDPPASQFLSHVAEP